MLPLPDIYIYRILEILSGFQLRGHFNTLTIGLARAPGNGGALNTCFRIKANLFLSVKIITFLSLLLIRGFCTGFLFGLFFFFLKQAGLMSTLEQEGM